MRSLCRGLAVRYSWPRMSRTTRASFHYVRSYWPLLWCPHAILSVFCFPSAIPYFPSNFPNLIDRCMNKWFVLPDTVWFHLKVFTSVLLMPFSQGAEPGSEAKTYELCFKIIFIYTIFALGARVYIARRSCLYHWALMLISLGPHVYIAGRSWLYRWWATLPKLVMLYRKF